MCKLAQSKMTEFKMAAIIQFEWEWMSLNQIKLVWVRVRVEWEWFWVNLREDNKVSETKMAVAESNMAQYKMAAIIKLSQNEWVKFFYVQMVGTNLGNCEWVWEEKLSWLNPRWPKSRWQIQDGCHHQVESEWMCEGFLCEWWQPILASEWVWEEKLRGLNPRCPNSRWQNSRWLPSTSWVKMNEWSFFVQNGWIQDGKIEDGYHHEVKWEWMSLSQIELDWVRVRMEWECFSMNPREDNKVSVSKMAVSESNMAEFKMAAIIKLSQNEWVKFFYLQMVGTNLGKCEWVWEEKLSRLNPKWPNSRWQIKMAAIIRSSENEWVWVRLN